MYDDLVLCMHELISVPGATTSGLSSSSLSASPSFGLGPLWEYPAMLSSLRVIVFLSFRAPTVITLSAEPGDDTTFAFWLPSSFPMATTTTTPAFTTSFAILDDASFPFDECSVPMDMERTEMLYLRALSATHSSPSMKLVGVADPSVTVSPTLQSTRDAFGATPIWSPPLPVPMMMPAQWVP